MNPLRFDESFNWLAVLKDLADGMPLSLDERSCLNNLAGQWPTCACGQLCGRLPKRFAPRWAPLDDLLYRLGLVFCHHVEDKEWRAALATFHRIEERTTELLLQVEYST